MMTTRNANLLRSGSPAIMVVEDTNGVRQIIRMQLKTLGYRVIEAQSGLEAVQLSKQEHPALILMDINMPDVDGLEATRIIRQTDEINAIPIIGLSAHYGMEIRNHALAAGCNDFVTKPVDFNLLRALISHYLNSD